MNALLKRLVVIDTETGGLDPLHHSLLSIGFVAFDGGAQTEIFVREPELYTHPKSMEVNGIDLDFIRREGLSPVAAVDAVEAFLDGLGRKRPLMMAGHNIQFDLAFMRRLYKMAGRQAPSEFTHRSVDTHTLLWALAAAKRLPRTATTSDGAFTQFDIAPPDELRHTALGDAVATRDLVAHLLQELGCAGLL